MNNKKHTQLLAIFTVALISTMIIPAYAQQAVIEETAGDIATPSDIPPGICGEVTVAFIVDTTGSMGGAIGNVKANLVTIMNTADLADIGGSAEYGLITFKDNVVVNNVLGPRAPVEASIGGLSASGGAGAPEAGDEAKNTAVNNLGPRIGQVGDFSSPAWTLGAGRTNIGILIGDAPPGGFNDVQDPADTARMHSVAVTAAAKGIKVSDIFVPTGGDYAGQAAIFKDDADTSGGIYLQSTASGSNVAQIILDILAECGGSGAVGGVGLGIDTTALLIAGASANAFWILPLLGVAAGTGLYLTRSKFNWI